MAYEYTGYGSIKGTVGEMELIYGVIESYEFLTQRLGFHWSRIIL